MKITQNEILHVAHLARLEMDASALDKFSGQISQILEYVDTLNRVDTEGVIPTSHAISLTNAFREDEETGGLDRQSALKNAPDDEDGHFLVPKIIE